MADYCTLDELKAALNISDTTDDTQLEAVITAASSFIDGHCNRDFTVAAGTTSRDYAPTGRYDVLLIDDCTTIQSVSIDDGLDGSFSITLGTADWQAEPLNGRHGGLALPYNRLRPLEDGYWPVEWRGRATVRVTATYGWSEIPPVVRQAAILQSSRLFVRYDSPLGVAGFGDLGAMRVSSRVDPDVAMMLSPYRRVIY